MKRGGDQADLPQLELLELGVWCIEGYTTCHCCDGYELNESVFKLESMRCVSAQPQICHP